MAKKIVEKMQRFMVLALGIGMFLGCNKEVGQELSPDISEKKNVQVSAKSNHGSFEGRLEEWIALGAYPADSSYKPSWTNAKGYSKLYLLKDSSGKVAIEIYHYDDEETYKENNPPLEKRLFISSSGTVAILKCEGRGNSCMSGVDTNGNGLIITTSK